MLQSLSSGQYDTVADFVDATRTQCANNANYSVVQDYIGTKAHGAWYGAGCNTGADVMRKLALGWPEGQARVERMRDKIDTSRLLPKDVKRRLVRRDMGDNLDISAVYAGRFQTAWTTAQRRSQQGPQKIDIVANMICKADDDADVLFWRGAAAVALCDLLESAGYMVRLVVGFGGVHDEGGKVSCRITVKDYDKPLDIATTSAVIMPGFFRAIGHGWIAGHCTRKTPSPSITVGESAFLEGERILSHQVKSESTALAWLNHTLDYINESSEGMAAA